MKKLSESLTSLAYDLVHGLSSKKEKCINLSEGEEWQGELYLYWHDGKFQATLDTYFYMGTTHGGYFDPPEHIYDEDQHEAGFVKIKDLVEWVKSFGFDLEEELG